jgi:UDP-N-acetylglucosamine 1-carboxyvinyltransferase
MGASIDLASACLGSKPCRFAHHDHLHSCIVRGPMKLKGRAIEIPDLRAGFAYLIAAMVAEGVSEVSGIRYVERGYAAVPEKLRGLGVNLEVLPSAGQSARTVPLARQLPRPLPALENRPSPKTPFEAKTGTGSGRA